MPAPQPRDLVGRRARSAVLALQSTTPVETIHRLWRDGGFARIKLADPQAPGVRKMLYDRYMAQVDWTSPEQVRRALEVFSETLRWWATHLVLTPLDDDNPLRRLLNRITETLAKDGYSLRESDWEIVGGGAVVTFEGGVLSNLTDPAAIEEQLDRITRAVGHGDDAQAIGSAKELIESTAKLVLDTLGEPVDDRAELPELVRAAQLALKVHPSSASPGPDGSAAVKKVLGGLTTITTGVAELRNRGYGTGHGQGAGVRTHLSARHARLAVGASKTWCQFMLDTLADPAALWRRAASRDADPYEA